jgi:hypothetical protein
LTGGARSPISDGTSPLSASKACVDEFKAAVAQLDK